MVCVVLSGAMLGKRSHVGAPARTEEPPKLFLSADIKVSSRAEGQAKVIRISGEEE